MTLGESALQQVRETRVLIDRCDDWLFGAIEPYVGERVLEVGCGLGNLTRHLVDRELVVGVDVSEASVAHVNSTYRHDPHVLAFAYDVTSPVVLSLKTHRFDTVVSLNVLEHIEDDRLALQRIHELLAPSGRLVLIVPAHRQLYGTMDRAIGHYRRYSDRDLTRKLHDARFEIIVQKHINCIGALGWMVNGRILRREAPPPSQLRLFNSMMGLIAAFERVFRLPFGLSILSVSERGS